MTRLCRRFEELGAAGKTALVIYVTEGDPTPEATAEITLAAAEAGADAVELGVPFSDPNADGPVIQEAMQRALAAGGGLRSALATARSVRAQNRDIPLILFGYYNPVFTYGAEALCKDAASAGVDALLTVDLPLEELGELAPSLEREGLAAIPLVAPKTGLERARRLAELAPPFVYFISTTGVTGAAFRGAAGGGERVAAVREAARAPVAVGFGIKTGDDARRVAAYADGVVVGSAVVSRIAEARRGREAEAVADLVRELRGALDAR